MSRARASGAFASRYLVVISEERIEPIVEPSRSLDF
jgi:hypothetical protein